MWIIENFCLKSVFDGLQIFERFFESDRKYFPPVRTESSNDKLRIYDIFHCIGDIGRGY